LPLQALAQNSADADKFLSIGAGTMPLILSAPHGGREAIAGVPLRRGVGVAQFSTGRDNNTDELAVLLASKIAAKLGVKPFVVIARFDRKFLDVNRPASGAYESAAAQPFYDAYHRALQQSSEKVRAQWGGGLLLDLHGQGAEIDTIYRGTDNGETVAALVQRYGKEAITGAHSIFGQLAAKGYRVLPDPSADDRERRYVGGYTARTYGSHRGTKIDAIQLEIGTNLRSKANLQRTAQDLAAAIEVFAKDFLPIDKSPSTERPFRAGFPWTISNRACRDRFDLRRRAGKVLPTPKASQMRTWRSNSFVTVARCTAVRKKLE
jgi:N-formylglutamate amidohydrolase